MKSETAKNIIDLYNWY